MGCGCGGSSKPNSDNKVGVRVATNDKKCPKCQSRMVYKQQFELKLKRYIKVWECSNKPCGNKIQSM